MMSLIKQAKQHFLLLTIICLFIIAKFCLLDTYFFWDSIATLSIPTHFLFENNFSSIAFPPNIIDDNLLTSSLLACTWKIFGKNLVSSHLLFSIIAIAFIYQLYCLCRYFIRDKKAFIFIFLLVISEPGAVTQSLLIMTDTLLLLLTVMSIRYMLLNKKLAFILSLFFLAMIRERGLMMCAGIGLAHYILLLKDNQWKNPFRVLRQALYPFIPVIFYFIAFYLYRIYMNQSLSLIRENTQWSEGRHWVDAKLFIKNIASSTRFFLDYGKCFIWLAFGFLFFKYGRKKLFSSSTATLWIILGGTLSFLLLTTLLINNSIGPRYFIFHFMLFAMITGILIFRLLNSKQAMILCSLLIVGLWSAHWWIYPEKISKPWDNTLAHLPYYQLRKDALQYIDDQKINYKDISSFFPASSCGEYIELNNDKRVFSKQDFTNNKYVVYSNIANWSDENIDRISPWPIEKVFQKNGIFIRIYKNPVKAQ